MTPTRLLVVSVLQARRIRGERLPMPPVGRGRIGHPQRPIAFQPGRDQYVALPCRFPDAFGVEPTIRQLMCLRVREQCQRLDLGHYEL